MIQTQLHQNSILVTNHHLIGILAKDIVLVHIKIVDVTKQGLTIGVNELRVGWCWKCSSDLVGTGLQLFLMLMNGTSSGLD